MEAHNTTRNGENLKNRTYRILLDGSWSLEDLTLFSRVYFQNYSFLYCLDTAAVEIASSRINLVLEKQELRGGLSYVNVYDIFRASIEKQDRPQISSIQYASPGWLELALNPDVAVQFAKVLGVYLSAPVAVAAAYKKLHKIYTDLGQLRKKTQLSTLKLDNEQYVEAQSLAENLAKGLGFNSFKDLEDNTKDSEESAKLIMAHYRRIRKVAKFVVAGKATFPKTMHE